MSRLEELERQMAELKAEIDREKAKRSWPPVFGNGKSYWTVTGDGKDCGTTWNGRGYDKDALKFGNVFENKEQAKWSAERDRLLRPALGPVMPSDEVLLSGFTLRNDFSIASVKKDKYMPEALRRHYMLGLWRPTKEEAERVRRGLMELIDKSVEIAR